MRATAIADLVAGRLEGGDDLEITGVAPLDRAGPQDLSFLAHPRYLQYVDASSAGLLLITSQLSGRLGAGRSRIIVDDVHRALAKVLATLHPESRREPGVHPTVVVGRGAVLGRDVSIGAYAVIGEDARLGDRVRVGEHCVIGAGCTVAADAVLHPQVTLYPNVAVGARSILHSGVRAGSDGFGYTWVDGGHQKVPQVGRCVIGDDVEIGANTTIDRGSVGATEIGRGVKIDNLVHIGHNVRIGEHSLIVAQVGISGSTTIGRHVSIAGQAGLGGHSEIGDGARIAGQAGVFGDVPAGETYSGYPARPHRESLRAQAGLSRLPRILERLKALERAILGRIGENE